MPDKIKKYLLWFLILVYFCGTFGFALNPDFFRPFTPFTLVLTSLVFLIYQPRNNLSYLSAFLTLVLLGFAAEAIGVKTGWVFGDYYYGKALGYKMLGVPLVISLNWALLIASGVLVGSWFADNKVTASLLSATIITGVDLLIEQVCAKMDFWYFESGLAGFQNYLAWFLISFVCSFSFYNILSKGNKSVAFIILSLQIFFFGITYIINLL